MASLTAMEIVGKIEALPDFCNVWSRLFFNGLSDMSPTTADMFETDDDRLRMARTLIGLILATLRDDQSRWDELRDIGHSHGEKGVLTIHMKVARGPVMRAAEGACPDLTVDEVARFGEAYDAIVTDIGRLGIGLKPASDTPGNEVRVLEDPVLGVGEGQPVGLDDVPARRR